FNNGNVGIGTTNNLANHRLSVIGGPLWTQSSWLGSMEFANGGAIGWRANSSGNRFGICQAGSGFFIFFTPRDPGGNANPTLGQVQFDNNGDVHIFNNLSIGMGTNPISSRLDVRGNLTLDPGVASGPTFYTSSTSGEQNKYLHLINSPSFQSASGLKAGGILVADSYSYANPGKNELVVKGNVGIGTASPTVAKLQVNDASVGTAVYGNSTIATGVFGQASTALFGGVEGDNSASGGIGVIGKANAASSVGVYGQSDNGAGVNGISANGFAMRADGNTYQQRDKGGWVKAMIRVAENATIL